MKHIVLFIVSLALPLTALGQAVPVPQKHIPSSVLMELRALEGQFDLALVRDCASERCVSKGCVYRDHAVVDLPRSSSLPGIVMVLVSFACTFFSPSARMSSR